MPWVAGGWGEERSGGKVAGSGQGSGALGISKTEEVRAGAGCKKCPGWRAGVDGPGLTAEEEQNTRSADPREEAHPPAFPPSPTPCPRAWRLQFLP